MLGPGGSWEVSQVKERKEDSWEWGDLEPGNDGNQMFPREISNPKRAGVVRSVFHRSSPVLLPQEDCILLAARPQGCSSLGLKLDTGSIDMHRGIFLFT